MNDPFKIVGIQELPAAPVLRPKWYQGKPILSMVLLGLIVLGCLFCQLMMTKDPTYMNLMDYNQAPNGTYLFGTDTMGRDIFSMIWYGGRISLFIGFFPRLFPRPSPLSLGLSAAVPLHGWIPCSCA